LHGTINLLCLGLLGRDALIDLSHQVTDPDVTLHDFELTLLLGRAAFPTLRVDSGLPDADGKREHDTADQHIAADC